MSSYFYVPRSTFYQVELINLCAKEEKEEDCEKKTFVQCSTYCGPNEFKTSFDLHCNFNCTLQL
jgi:hypothetical protein